MWLYGSGFPKSMNIGLAVDKKNGVESKVIGIKEHCKKDFKESNLYAQDEANKNNTKCFGYGIEIIKEAQNQWRGWGTALKPSFEPIIVARKPLDGTCVDNVIKWGVGGINIDECRIGDEYIKGGTMPDLRDVGKKSKEAIGIDKLSFGQVENASRLEYEGHNGRFPANTILTYDETDFEEVCGGFPNTKGNGNVRHNKNDGKGYNCYSNYGDCDTRGYDDSGSASRYFYCAKASKKDRDEGLESFENVLGANITGRKEGSAGLVMAGGKQNPFAGKASPNNKNTHPTVKPTSLMQYLVRLVTPRGGTILDPFMGSGSTGKAVAFENKERQADYSFIGIEKETEYCEIARARIEFANNYKEETEDNQISFNDLI